MNANKLKRIILAIAITTAIFLYLWACFKFPILLLALVFVIIAAGIYWILEDIYGWKDEE